MKISFTKCIIILISLIKFSISNTNITIRNENIKTNQEIIIPENITISNISKTPLDVPIINTININKTSEVPIIENENVTLYDNNKILDIIMNSPKQSDHKNNSETQTIIKDYKMDKMEDEVQNIIIQNTHEDQLAESLFYFLCFVLIIFIILFLYKFYKCYCQNTIKDFGEEGTMRNPNNDPELQRISLLKYQIIISKKIFKRQ